MVAIILGLLVVNSAFCFILLKNRKKGKDINGISLVYYDLAILLGKYDAYLKWKEQQKLAQADAEEQRVKNIEFVGYRDVLPQRQKKWQKRRGRSITAVRLLQRRSAG